MVLYDEVADRQGNAHCIRSLGQIALYQHEYADAAQQFEQAIVLYDEAADRKGKAHCIHCLGRIAFEQHDCPDAKQCFEQARGCTTILRIGGERLFASTAWA